MKKIRNDLALQMMKLVNTILITIPFAMCWLGYYAGKTNLPMTGETQWYPIVAYIALYTIMGHVYEAFEISNHKISEMICSQTLAAVIADGFEFIFIWVMMQRFPNILPGLAALVGQIVLSTVWSTATNHWYYRTFGRKATAVVYDVRLGMDRLIEECGLDRKYDVKYNLSAEECLRDISVLDGLDVVFLSGVHSHERNVILKYCVEHGVTMYLVPRIGDTIMSGAKRENLFHLPILRVGRYNPSLEYLLIKRLFDIVSASIVALILSPVMIATAIAVKSDGGPAFYRQTRLTKDGREFKVFKFRSMRVDAEKDGIARLSTGEQDDRITPVGKIIRKIRLDELPQLFNIIGGSMSVVGPRPERSEIAKQYEKELPEFRLRLQAKAGLTGLAQVYGKYNTTPYDKLQMDLMYIANPGILEDLRIIFATVKVLFMKDSTEGISEGQINAMDSTRNAKSA